MLFQILLLISFVWFVLKRWKLRRVIRLSNKIGSRHRALPLIGHSYMFAGGGEKRMTAFRKFGAHALANGGVTSLWLGADHYTVIADPVIAEVVLKTCLEKGDMMAGFGHLLGNGSLISRVQVWRPRRRAVIPAFSLKNLQSFVEVFSRQSGILNEQLSGAAGAEAFSVWKYFAAYTMDSVCETVLGVSVHAQKLTRSPFLSCFEEYCQLAAARMCQPWLQLDALYKALPAYTKLETNKKYICNYVKQIIQSKREELKEKESLGDDPGRSFKSFLELLLDASVEGGGFSDLELLEETLVLVLAGTDTSAVGACFTAAMLSRHQDQQNKVYEELSQVFGDTERAVEAADLPRLKYLEAVIKESMRLYPPVAIISRMLDKDVTLPSGLTLVRGSGAIVNIWALHRHPRYWGEDAEQFRPERFLEEPLQHHAAFMPFSHGPRNCIGYQYAMMSMKTALASVVRRYRVLPAGPGAGAPLRVAFDVMTRDAGSYTVRLQPRARRRGGLSN